MLARFALILLATQASAAFATDRMMTPSSPSVSDLETLSVRLTSPQGVLWQGNLRVTQNQGANYSQNFNQASTTICPPNSPYDRSERYSINFNIYVQNNGELGRSFRVDASWQRPSEDSGCGDRGTRTVQVNKGLMLNHGETGVVEGDAGLKVEVTRN